MNELNQARHDKHVYGGKLTYSLEVFGDSLAEKHGYDGLSGLDAVRYYLMQKHHWLPRDLHSMSHDDLRFALTQELAGWTLPAAERTR